MLTLYHAEPVANSMKVLLCLHEKKIAFESRYVDLLAFEQHEPWFVAINPNGQVPVLVHDGAVVTESTVINEYLEEVFPANPLMPADAVGRARVRVWTKFVDEYFNPAVSMIGWHTMVRRIAQSLEKDELARLLERIPLEEQRQKWATVAGQGFTEEQLADSRRKIGVSLEKAEGLLERSAFLAGDRFTLADVASYSLIAGAPRLFPELMSKERTPRLVAYLERLNERPGVRAALAMPNKVPEKLRTFG